MADDVVEPDVPNGDVVVGEVVVPVRLCRAALPGQVLDEYLRSLA